MQDVVKGLQAKYYTAQLINKLLEGVSVDKVECARI